MFKIFNKGRTPIRVCNVTIGINETSEGIEDIWYEQEKKRVDNLIKLGLISKLEMPEVDGEKLRLEKQEALEEQQRLLEEQEAIRIAEEQKLQEEMKKAEEEAKAQAEATTKKRTSKKKSEEVVEDEKTEVKEETEKE